MIEKPLSEVYLGDGQGGGFWEVSFNTLQLRHADIETEDMRTICVHVDETTGEISQSEGYAPGSRENRDETSLFSEFEDAIVREMVSDHRFASNASFLARAKEDEFRRGESLEVLEMNLSDLKDEDDDRD